MQDAGARQVGLSRRFHRLPASAQGGGLRERLWGACLRPLQFKRVWQEVEGLKDHQVAKKVGIPSSPLSLSLSLSLSLCVCLYLSLPSLSLSLSVSFPLQLRHSYTHLFAPFSPGPCLSSPLNTHTQRRTHFCAHAGIQFVPFNTHSASLCTPCGIPAARCHCGDKPLYFMFQARHSQKLRAPSA